MEDQKYVLWQYPLPAGFVSGKHLLNTEGLKPFFIRLFENFQEAVDYKLDNNLKDEYQIEPYSITKK